jgi:hypothetical protein
VKTTCKDHSYFAAIEQEMDNVGREALPDYLLRYDLSKVDLRTIPKTAALLDQKFATLSNDKAWWLDVLQSGRLPWGCDCASTCAAQRLFDSYITHATKTGVRHRSIATQIGIFLGKVVPSLRMKSKGTFAGYNGKQETRTLYLFPPLHACREAFARLLGQDIEWTEMDAWSTDPEPAEARRYQHV